MTKKRNIANNQSNTNYDLGNEIIYNTEVLKSNFFDYNDAYILARGDLLQLPQHKYHSKIGQHLLNVSQNLMEQQ